MVVWLPFKNGFINSYILETSKDRPNTSPSLKFLEQRVYELVEGSAEHPLDNVVGSKRLRVKILHFLPSLTLSDYSPKQKRRTTLTKCS